MIRGRCLLGLGGCKEMGLKDTKYKLCILHQNLIDDRIGL